MNSVIEKLAEVEETAEAIVEHARQQKSEIEKQIQEERNQFDRDLEEETQKKLEKIKAKSQQEVEKVLDRERKKDQGNIMTEYEAKFSSMGNPICKLIAKRR